MVPGILFDTYPGEIGVKFHHKKPFKSVDDSKGSPLHESYRRHGAQVVVEYQPYSIPFVGCRIERAHVVDFRVTDKLFITTPPPTHTSSH